jgi:hypothetical protein
MMLNVSNTKHVDVKYTHVSKMYYVYLREVAVKLSRIMRENPTRVAF